MNIPSIMNIAKRQSGFTLLEILVALVLGVGLLAATISMQLQHKKGFTYSTNKLQMQTNAKFAFEFIGRSLRSAGGMGCKTGLEFKGDAVNEDNGCFGGVCIEFNNPMIAYANFVPGFEVQGYEYVGTGLIPSPSTAFDFSSLGYYNDNSDVISIAGGYGEIYSLEEGQVLAATSGDFKLDLTNVSDVDLKQSQYGMLTSCKGAKIFKVTNTDTDIDAGNIQWGGGGGDTGNRSGQLGSEAYSLVSSGEDREFRRAAVTSYYAGTHPHNTATGTPVLYQDVDGESHQLVTGVEEMHILYGMSDNPAFRNVADRYVTADTIAAESTLLDNAWERVASVRIGLIMRSTDEVYEDDKVQNITLDCVSHAQLTKTDKFARSAYCSEVSLRNRLVGTRTGNKD